MKNLFDSNKGQAENYFAALVVIFVLGMLSLIGYLILDLVIDTFSSAGYLTEPAAISAAAGFLTGIQMFDVVMVLLVVGLSIGVIVTTYKIASAPVGYIMTIIMAAFWGFVAYLFSHIYGEYSSNTIFLTVTAKFPITLFVCTNLHWFMLLWIVIGGITLYGKRERGQFV